MEDSLKQVEMTYRFHHTCGMCNTFYPHTEHYFNFTKVLKYKDGMYYCKECY